MAIEATPGRPRLRSAWTIADHARAETQPRRGGSQIGATRAAGLAAADDGYRHVGGTDNGSAEIMKKTAGDNLCERLMEWGIHTIYGFPGDGINGILGALRRHEDDLRFVQTRHEEMAA